MGEMTWQLADPGMDLLERLGLAALYMTLRAADAQSVDLAPLSWNEIDLTQGSVTVRWEGPAREAFVQLFRYAWQVRGDVIYAPSVHREAVQLGEPIQRVPLHSGVLSTFLQHPRVQPKGDVITRVEEIDEGKSLEYRYQSLGGNELKPLKDLEEFFDREGRLVDGTRLSGWVKPGAAPRYGDERAWSGPGRLGLLLMLAPAACLYLRLPGKGGWVIVAPDVHDLEEYDEVRPLLSPDPAYSDVSSLGDAALRFASDYAAHNARRQLSRDCRVIAMGKVDYYPNQTVRKAIIDAAPSAETVVRFRVLNRVMPYRYVARPPKPEGVAATASKRKPRKRPVFEATGPEALGFMRAPGARGRIADNLASERSWYVDLFAPPPWERDSLDRQRKTAQGLSPEHIWFRNLGYQRGELMQLIAETTMWDREDERILVEACHEALRALFAKEAEAIRTRKGSRSLTDRWSDLKEDIRRELMHAKTRHMLRGVLASLFARADYAGKKGSPGALRQHLPSVWRLIDDPHDWRKARDLALLALASYTRKQDAGDGGADAEGDPDDDTEGQGHEEIKS